MEVLENHDLRPYNTFGVSATARFFTRFHSVDDIREFSQAAAYQNHSKLVLGGGSNILLTRDFDGAALKVDLKGKEVVREDDQHWYLRVGAGENWHELVMHCVANGYAGIENLSLIPGNMGAAPMQNIGAYGVELKAVFHELEAVEMATGEVLTFSHADCQFGYRESVFKRAWKNRVIIASVTLRLNKTPSYNTSYGAIEKELEAMGVQDLSISAISQAVINIRRSKLPDPAQIGNAGSFFKNPVIPSSTYQDLLQEFPNMVGYKVSDAETKVAAGWLIDQAGWKGKTFDNYGVHKNQALVLVNYGGAAGSDIYDLSGRIMDDVKSRYGIQLEREVNIH